MKKFVLILGGGKGIRAGGDIPKQFRNLGGVPVIWRAVKAFRSQDPSTGLGLVIHPGYYDFWGSLVKGFTQHDKLDAVTLIPGGESRLESVRNGLEWIAGTLAEEEDAIVAVHDGARPFVTEKMISDGWKTGETAGAAVPVVEMTDSIRELLGDGKSVSQDRSRYVRVQTPQVFRFRNLLEAYRSVDMADKTLTDDASIVERQGLTPALYHGDEKNIKITRPLDFIIAEAMLAESGMA